MLKTLLAEVKQYKKASILTPAFMVGEVVMEILIPMPVSYTHLCPPLPDV